MKRDSGFYWCKMHSGSWTIAFWSETLWFVIGCEKPRGDKDWQEIGVCKIENTNGSRTTDDKI